MIVAIHQPNFFPWLGYFQKIAKCDVFIFLDDVQFPRSGAGVNANRVKMLVSGEARWVTASIDRKFKGSRNINQMLFNDTVLWREKILKTIETNYKKTKYFDEIFPFLNALISNPESNVSQYNSSTVLGLSGKLGINSNKFYWSSKLAHGGNSNELLASLTKAVGGESYLTGKGASAYLDGNIYKVAGIQLIHQNFQHPEYVQYNSSEFVAGLSIVDALMNIGFQNVTELLMC
jgi:hypothetical protein